MPHVSTLTPSQAIRLYPQLHISRVLWPLCTWSFADAASFSFHAPTSRLPGSHSACGSATRWASSPLDRPIFWRLRREDRFAPSSALLRAHDVLKVGRLTLPSVISPRRFTRPRKRATSPVWDGSSSLRVRRVARNDGCGVAHGAEARMVGGSEDECADRMGRSRLLSAPVPRPPRERSAADPWIQEIANISAQTLPTLS